MIAINEAADILRGRLTGWTETDAGRTWESPCGRYRVHLSETYGIAVAAIGTAHGVASAPLCEVHAVYVLAQAAQMAQMGMVAVDALNALHGAAVASLNRSPR